MMKLIYIQAPLCNLSPLQTLSLLLSLSSECIIYLHINSYSAHYKLDENFKL